MRFTLTNLLIAANIAAYLWQITRGGVGTDHGYLWPELVRENGQWWRIFSAAFLHWNIAHIGLNMIALGSVGSAVETLFGKARFALVYLTAIVGSGLAVVYFSTPGEPTAGASGAIFGLFGALVAAGVRMGSRGRQLVMSVVPVLAVNLVLTFTIPNISAAGHVGGLITGFIIGFVLFMGEPQRRYLRAYAAAEIIEEPPDAGPHEEAGAPALHVRDPRE